MNAPRLLCETSPKQAIETYTLRVSYEWLEDCPTWWPNWMKRLRICWHFTKQYLATQTIAVGTSLDPKPDGLNWLREALQQQGHLHTWKRDPLGNTETCPTCHLGRFTTTERRKLNE